MGHPVPLFGVVVSFEHLNFLFEYFLNSLVTRSDSEQFVFSGSDFLSTTIYFLELVETIFFLKDLKRRNVVRPLCKIIKELNLQI